MPDEQTPGSSQTPPDAQQNEIDQKIAATVNAAVTAHLRRFTEKQLPELLGNALKPITDKLNAPPPADEGKPKKGDPNPELLAMQKKLDEALGTLDTERKQRVEVEQKARSDRAYGEVLSALADKVRPELKDTLVKVFRSDNRVTWSDDGQPLFKTDKKNPWDDSEQAMPLADGLADWLKSDAAKPFLPAPAAGAAAGQFQQKKPGTFQQSQQQQQQADPARMTDKQKIAWARDREARIAAKLGQ